MKKLFGTIFAILVLASTGMYWSAPDRGADVPILYWSTNPTPNRLAQIEDFHRWLVRHGHTTEDGRPLFELRLIPSDYSIIKTVMQGVSGVSADLIDMAGGMTLRYLNQIGMLDDVTDDAVQMGFDPSHTYPVLQSQIMVTGRQYTFPRLVTAFMYNVNLDTFSAAGLAPPPRRWTFEQFEQIGKQFVKAANKPGKRQTVFFANEVRPVNIYRSLGLSVFNETLTRCTLDDPRYVRTLELIYKWKYVDHLLPTAAQLKSIATHQVTQFGDSREHLFVRGNYAMIFIGRHSLPLLRSLGRINLAVAEPPHGGLPNTDAAATCTGIYRGSAHRDLARYFLAYLAGEQFNMMTVRNTDGVPPDPAVTSSRAYLQPAEYPNEWGCHQAFSDALKQTAIAGVFSPFVGPQIVSRLTWQTQEGFMSGLYSAQTSARRVTDRINQEIQRTLHENPALQDRYDQLIKLQADIDLCRSKHQRVPLSWISNPVHRRYYQFKGWIE